MKDGADDAVLIARSRAGDTTAFGMLVRRYQDDLFNGVCRMLGNHADAADVAQDVFLRAFESIGNFRGAASFYTWLYAIAVNACISHSRSQRSHKRHLHVSLATGGKDAPELDLPANDPQPNQAAELAEEYARAESALQQLPEDCRIAIVLRDIEGYGYNEISALLNCSLGTVKSRLFRGREKLRELLNR